MMSILQRKKSGAAIMLALWALFLLSSMDELKKVASWGDYTTTAGWDGDFTLNSSGPIDLAWASRDVLISIPGLTPEMVDRFLQLRQGPDGIDGTEDDMQFKGIDE